MLIFSSFLYTLKQMFSIFIASVIALSSTLGIQISFKGCTQTFNALVSYSFYDPTVKIMSSGLMDKTKDYEMYLAKNEREACQVAFRSRVNRNNMRVVLSDFTNENGDVLETEIFSEYYVQTKPENTLNNTYPDALVPIDENTVIYLRPEATAPFYINVISKKDTPAGDYTAKLKLYNVNDPDNKRETINLEIKAHVWNFAVPDTPASATAMGYNKSYIAKAHGVDVSSEKAQELYQKYYEFMIERRMSPSALPVDILSDEADKYMSDPRVTSFTIPYYGDDATLQTVYGKVQSNPEWAKKAYFYPVDEPSNDAAFNTLNQVKERLDRLCPGYSMVTPFTNSKMELFGETKNVIDLIANASDRLCCLSTVTENDGYLDDLYSYVSTGDYQPWWYVCCDPGGDYCNLFVTNEGIRHRILFWQQKDLNIEGFLYWETTYWPEVGYCPWTSAITAPWTNERAIGDGSLLYNGNYVGIDGPVSSLRLEGVANGLEDYDYLTMAEELLGEKFVDKTIDKVTKDLTTYTFDDGKFAEVRIELGNAIEEAFNK